MKVPQARFVLNSAKGKKSEVLIIMQYYLPGEKNAVRFSTLQFCIPRFWDKSTRRVKNSINYPIHSSINKVLNELNTIAQDIFIASNGRIDREAFKKELEYRTGRKERIIKDIEVTLFSFFEDYIKERLSRPDANKESLKKYTTLLGNLKAFSSEQKESISFESIDWQFKTKFESWMYAEPRKFSKNNVSKIFNYLNKVLKEAFKRGYHKNEIFRDEDFKVSRIKVKNKPRLTALEVQQLIKYDFSDRPHLEKVRDMFITACFSGLRISDWSKIDRDHIRNIEGVLFLELMAQKNGREVLIPVMDELLNVLKKYDYNIPTMADQVFNRSIKEVVKIVIPDSTYLRIYNEGGINKEEVINKWKKVSSHVGRRTFASNRYLEGWDIKKIQNILGHASQKTTEEYMDISDRELSIRTARLMKLQQSYKLRIV